MIILGIDPGIATMGYGVVDKDGNVYGCDDTKREIGEKRPFAAHNYSSESGYCFVWKM